MVKRVSRLLSGHHWEFPGGAESSVQMVIRKINENPRMSNAQKQELIESVTYMAGHILSDVEYQINCDYTSAHSSGIEYMKWHFEDDKPGWFLRTFFANTLRRLRMNLHLSDEGAVHNVRERISKTVERLTQ